MSLAKLCESEDHRTCAPRYDVVVVVGDGGDDDDDDGDVVNADSVCGEHSSSPGGA